MSSPRIPLCYSCADWTYQPCYVAGVFEMHQHCAGWHRDFPHAISCHQYRYEPGCDPEWRGDLPVRVSGSQASATSRS